MRVFIFGEVEINDIMTLFNTCYSSEMSPLVMDQWTVWAVCGCRADRTFRPGKVKMEGGLLFTDALHVLKLNDSGIRTS